MKSLHDGRSEHPRYRKKQAYNRRGFDVLEKEREIQREKQKKFDEKREKKKVLELDYSPIEILAQRYGLRSCFKYMTFGMSQRYLYDKGKIFELTRERRGNRIRVERKLLDLDYDNLRDE